MMKVSNPLTIIAIFAGVSETFATVALIKLPPDLQDVFIYFVMFFPLVIVVTFFLILFFKPYVLYAPSDFDDESHFMEINQLKDTIAAVTESALESVSNSGEKLDTKEISRQVAASTINKLEDNLNERVFRYMSAHPNEAFTARGLGHILSANKYSLTFALHHLETEGKIEQGKDGDTIVWQIKT
ncbi:hypothetical protein P3384_23880 [Vibrio parahaemolyticus]|nr:hypothetical protein [Vibrio parahaemolyticus]MDF4467049.1 hypothetical protein [Vibrio parahaemolyticus]MDF4471786.1 hypothetical protein [Vibrio parahaemolyticus]MDF4495053.1 hypothetical protein [Vibrio parahaemolyticus]MDG2570690.1 hypothetical protein [Vibrio parahaemolyticus]